MVQQAQQVLVAQVARALVAACPPGWRAAQVVQRQVGSRVERELLALTGEGPVVLAEPAGLDEVFAQLRALPPLWFTARVRVAPPDRFTLDTDDADPYLAGAPLQWQELADDPAVRAAGARPAWVDAVLASALLAGRPGAEPGGTVVATAIAPGGRAGAGPEPEGPPVVRTEGRVEPLPGEPPLSLLRSVQLMTLPVGTELDRLGGPEGNVVWVARTPWPLRSLPPEHAERPYSAFVLLRPVEALVGQAVPWFGQPGGGTAFVLPASVAALVAAGAVRQVA